MRASILGRISSSSWKANTKSVQPARLDLTRVQAGLAGQQRWRAGTISAHHVAVRDGRAP
jgi:hypothetical protein